MESLQLNSQSDINDDDTYTNTLITINTWIDVLEAVVVHNTPIKNISNQLRNIYLRRHLNIKIPSTMSYF